MTLSTASDLSRFGIKGRAAADWLTANGIGLPSQANGWLLMADQSRVLRLGRGEYLIEGPSAMRLQSAWIPGTVDLYRVPRYDASFVLSGSKTTALLREICALDTRQDVLDGKVCMTLAAGISVTLICEAGDAEPVYRLWCDATYGDYLFSTLQTILAQPV